MSHLEDTSLQLEGTVGHVHDLEPVTVAYLPRVELLKEGKELEIVFNLGPQLSRGIPLLLLNWKTLID